MTITSTPNMANLGQQVAEATLRAELQNNLLCNADGQTPKPCLANAIQFLRYDPAWQGVLGYNTFSLHAMALKSPPWGGICGRWTDNMDSLAAEWLQRRAGVLVNSAIAAEAVQAVAMDNPYHPVQDYVRGLVWDCKPRIDNWLTFYMGVESTNYTKATGAKWLISAVARAMNPGCKADCVLLIEGKQGLGKSTALRILASDEWFTDHISTLGSKDAMLELAGNWIVELAELDARRSEQETIKAFLSRTYDKFRAPYGRRIEAFPRSCVFAASCNDQTPLRDATGARRWWSVLATTIDTELLARDRDQLWAEAYRRWREGASWWLETDELKADAASEADKRYDPGAWDDLITVWCDAPTTSKASDHLESTPSKILMHELLLHALQIETPHITQSAANSAARCLVHNGWKRRLIREGEKRRWFYVREERTCKP
jgi:predicted P-loop ATPase